jgi:hypothetical protein
LARVRAFWQPRPSPILAQEPRFYGYWGEHGRQNVGKVIVAGAENAHVPAMLGWDRAESLTEAIAMAKSFVGPSPEITMMHHPPIVMADME